MVASTWETDMVCVQSRKRNAEQPQRTAQKPSGTLPSLLLFLIHSPLRHPCGTHTHKMIFSQTLLVFNATKAAFDIVSSLHFFPFLYFMKQMSLTST